MADRLAAGDVDISTAESPQCLDFSETSEAAMASDLSDAIDSLRSQLMKDDSSFIEPSESSESGSEFKLGKVK